MLGFLFAALGVIALASIVTGATVHLGCEVVALVWRRYISWR